MKRRVLVAAWCVAASLALPGPVAADQTAICPDQMVPVPAVLVPKGDVRDRNENGIVCVKLIDGKVHGGPDDQADDILV